MTSDVLGLGIAIFYASSHGWSVEVGNPSQSVMLGESTGEFWSRHHPTMAEAPANILAQISGSART